VISFEGDVPFYDMGYIDSMFYTKSKIDSTVANYPTKTDLNRELKNYVTKSVEDLEFYYTREEIKGIFTSFCTKNSGLVMPDFPPDP
jgi:hypothetical protein